MGIYGVDMGHCISGADSGAEGILLEVDVTRGVGNALISELQSRGHIAVNCTVDYANSVDASLIERARKSNAQNLDLFIVIHGNKSPSPQKLGTGTETYVCSRGNYSSDATYNKNVEIAKRVNDSICNSLGYANRGVKIEDWYVLTASNSLAIYIETFFIDNPEDVARADYRRIAKAIADGILGEAVTPPVTPPVKPPTTGEYTIEFRDEVGQAPHKCTITDKLGAYFYNTPYISTNSGSYEYMESVYYDKVLITNKYIYVSWMGDNGRTRRYMPIEDKSTGERWAKCE